jgi:DNA-binding response OmpR family regulator
MKKILIVEDEKNIILSLKMFFEKNGYDICIKESGAEGIQGIDEFSPDLVLLDIVLPDMNGYLVCEAIRERFSKDELPIFFMSAKSQEKDIKKAYDVGGNEYLMKPFDLDKLSRLTSEYTGGVK